jgi:hypothetical protein
MALENIEDFEDIYYFYGNYIYNILRPEINCDIEMFKYIIGRIFLNSI